jgi:hypothetical protein
MEYCRDQRLCQNVRRLLCILQDVGCGIFCFYSYYFIGFAGRIHASGLDAGFHASIISLALIPGKVAGEFTHPSGSWMWDFMLRLFSLVIFLGKAWRCILGLRVCLFLDRRLAKVRVGFLDSCLLCF